MKFYFVTITVLFDSPLSKMGVNKINMWRKTGCRVGLNHSRMWKTVIFRGIPATGKEVDSTNLQPSRAGDRKTSWRDEPRIATGGFQFSGCILWISDFCCMFFHDVSLWRSCRFQCILEKRCWPTCFFSLSVLLESELVCEVWEDYLNKLFFDVVSESNWELFRTASWNQDLGGNRPMGFLSTCWKTIHGVDRVWFCWKNQQPADEDWSFLFWKWGK